jgi:GTP cyclohydrolase I
VRAVGARTVTSALRGLHREHVATRQEFFQLIGTRS